MNAQERTPMPSEPYSFGTLRLRHGVGQWEVNGILRGTPQWGPGAMAKPGVSPPGTAQPQASNKPEVQQLVNPYAAMA
jgi:hypothetical protein